MASESLHITIPEELSGERLDKALATLLPDYSRSHIKQWIDDGLVTLADDDSKISPKHKVSAEENYQITPPEARPSTLTAQDIPLDIVFEDDDIIVLNKQVGLTVHPGAGQWDNTLVNALLHHCGDTLSSAGGSDRPGIVHRLDKMTSGLMVVAKHDIAHKHLAEQLEAREIKRTYHAVAWGLMTPPVGTINANLDRHPKDRIKRAVCPDDKGRHAITHYKVIEAYSHMASLVECRLETGRTHQIRVHLAHKGHPILGDATYGAHRNAPNHELLSEDDYATITNFSRQALHAYELAFSHPKTAEELAFQAPYPADMLALVNALKHLKQGA